MCDAFTRWRSQRSTRTSTGGDPFFVRPSFYLVCLFGCPIPYTSLLVSLFVRCGLRPHVAVSGIGPYAGISTVSGIGPTATAAPGRHPALIGPGAALATLERRCRRKMYVGLGRKLAGAVSAIIGRKWEWVGAKVPKWERLASRKGTAAHFRVCLFCVSACAIAWVRVHTRRSLGERYSVSGFPTIKWFPKGTAPPLTYK